MPKLIKLPGMIDIHTHLRDPGATQKEDFYTGTCAALAGGVIALCDMPNNPIPTVSLNALQDKEKLAQKKALCDYGLYLGATADNYPQFKKVANRAAGLKIYMNETTGPLLVENLADLENIFQNWPSLTRRLGRPKTKPIMVHAEDSTVAEVLGLSATYNKWVHFCHLSQASEIELVKIAKEKGMKVTCEVTPHHLFLTEKDAGVLGGYGKVKPPLRKPSDRDALWKNLKVVDAIASDHAPHTKEEKESPNPPSGMPGLETTLPLFLTAVSQGRLSMDELVRLTFTGPCKILGVKLSKNSYLEVDPQEKYTIKNKNLKTKCGWSPFAGFKVQGRVKRVFIRGKKVFEDGQILASSGFGQNLYSA